MYPISYNIDDWDATKGDLQKLLKENALNRYMDDTSFLTPRVVYEFTSEDLAYCFLSKQERSIYDVLNNEFQTTKQISEKSGLPTKNVSSILLKMLDETNLIEKDIINSKRLQWRMK